MWVCQPPSAANCGSGPLHVCIISRWLSRMMSRMYAIMRCITICMQGITLRVQTLPVHKCISRLLLASPAQCFASGPRDLATRILFCFICIYLCVNGQYGCLLMAKDSTLWQICEDIKLDNSTMQPLQCLWHHFSAILLSVFWQKLITSTALYCYDNAERCEVDSVDFITPHFHMNNSAEEAFNLPTYLCSPHTVLDANVRAHAQTYSLARKKQHITIDNCPSWSLTGLFSSISLWCSIRLSGWSASRDVGGCRGRTPSLIN